MRFDDQLFDVLGKYLFIDNYQQLIIYIYFVLKLFNLVFSFLNI